MFSLRWFSQPESAFKFNVPVLRRLMAEVHIIGTLDGGEGFSSPNVSCKWSLEAGGAWRLLEGNKDGETQVKNKKTSCKSKIYYR